MINLRYTNIKRMLFVIFAMTMAVCGWSKDVAIEIAYYSTSSGGGTYQTTSCPFEVGGVSFDMVNYNPVTGQIRGNQDDSNLNFYLYNKTAIPGTLKSVTIQANVVDSKTYINTKTQSLVSTANKTTFDKLNASGQNPTNGVWNNLSGTFFCISMAKGGTSGTVHMQKVIIVYDDGEPDEQSDYDVSITPVGYSTYYNSQQAYVMPEQTEGYIVFNDEGEWCFEKAYSAGETVPAGEALVLKGLGQKNLEFVSSDNQPKANNALKGTDIATALAINSNQNFYALSLGTSNEPNSVGFYFMNETGAAFTNGAHKAYLAVDKSSVSSAKMRGFAFADIEANAIHEVVFDSPDSEQKAYNIAGQRVAADTKGIVIVNGKKMFNR